MAISLSSEFYCCNCGTKGIPIARRKGAEREAGHLKRLYCLKCGKEFNHVECKEFTKYDYDCFLLEFNNGNFDKDGNRIMPFGLFKDKLMKRGVI